MPITSLPAANAAPRPDRAMAMRICSSKLAAGVITRPISCAVHQNDPRSRQGCGMAP
eukprot:CAMPEP_0181172076 /NCGR_PEP_ID=MMETSP1096-20121128/2260_1 /TAXON_ID=156174 ORGANISM="Chrysochromulina ericina, Strain CCMP281" /NCGR_SAMPLE_ID=MMETSP1096 /ASSEMBLY_ACC=CAM_ASM_000453 /LENGTH=56 /DNA_ID=CAMNT_0023259787 /DNA_START=895 /DNA_END=1065 /DNA_ORIENTATION=-